MPSAHQLHSLPALEVLVHGTTRTFLGVGHTPHAKFRARLQQPERRQHVKKRAVDQRVPESRRVAGTPVPPVCELELPEQAFALLLWHLSAGAFCEQRKAGLRVPDQIEFIVDLIDVVDDEAKFMNFLRMEKWLADRPHHPGEAAKQWLKDLYQENRLVEGSFVLSGRQVDLKSIAAPVLNVFALDDHIIPPDCSRALGAKIGSKDYTEIPLPGGHVGLFVSSKSQGKLSQSIADWLLARDANPVSEG